MEKLVLLGTVGSDVHSVANTLIEKALLDSGFRVKNLGVAVPEVEWVNFAKSLSPDLVLIGSMNGDLLPLTNLIESLSNFLAPGKIIVGGKLNLGSQGLSSGPLIKAMGVTVLDSNEINFEEIVGVCVNIVGLNRDLNLTKNNYAR